MYDILACLSLCILRFVSLDASFEITSSHPSRCSELRILRDALMCASFAVPYCLHPSRCFGVCILRGALLYVEKTSTILLLLLPDELSARVMLRKTSPPFLALGSLGP